jgi:Hpt domain
MPDLIAMQSGHSIQSGSDIETTAGVGATVTREPRAAWTVDELRTVWEHQRGRVRERIDVVDRAIASLAQARLDTEIRSDAERAAHMLAGSIGTFGFVAASRAARALELELANPTPDRAPTLAALLVKVRSGIDGPVVLCPGNTADTE